MGSLFVDVHCDTCNRKITLEEIAADYHRQHIFQPSELAALQAVRDYLNTEQPFRTSA